MPQDGGACSGTRPVKHMPNGVGGENMGNQVTRIRAPVLTLLVLALLLIGTLSVWKAHQRAEEEIVTETSLMLSSAEALLHWQLAAEAEQLNAFLAAMVTAEIAPGSWSAAEVAEMRAWGESLHATLRDRQRIDTFRLLAADGTCLLRLPASLPQHQGRSQDVLEEARRSPGSAWEIEWEGKALILHVVLALRSGDQVRGYLDVGKSLAPLVAELSGVLGARLVLTTDASTDANVPAVVSPAAAGGQEIAGPANAIEDGILPADAPEIFAALASRPSVAEERLWYCRSDRRICHAGHAPLLDASGQGIGQLVMVRDITQQESGIRNRLAALLLIILLASCTVYFGFHRLLGLLQRRLDEATSSLEETIERQERSERQLQVFELRLRTVVDSTRDAMICINQDGLITIFNPAAEAMFGQSRQKMIGQPLDPLLPVDRRDQHRHDVACFFAAGGPDAGIGNILELTARRGDGTEFPIELSLAAGRVEGEQFAIAVVRDISERRRAQKALLSAKEMAEVANRAKSAFLASISHEMRTPLNGILGATDLLQTGTDQDEQKELIGVISSLGESLLNLVNDVLDFEKLQSGKLALEKVDFDLHAMVADAVRSMGPQARKRDLEIQAHLSPAVPNRVHGDPARVRQVITILLDNALKFTHIGKVTVAVEPDPGAPGGDPNLLFSVTDTGIGIPEGKQKHLFEPFAQADASTTRRYGGTGLGLAIARQVTEALNGRISFESEENVGSTFRIHLPLPPAAVDAVVPLKAAGPPSVPRKDSRDPLDADAMPARVLLVEDLPEIRRVMRQLLHNQGCSVVEVAEDGAMALAMLKERHYDLVLMDCMMPVMDGYQATREIRAWEGKDRHTPVIALTARAMPGDREECLSAGMDDYLAKPVSSQTLRAVLRRWSSACGGRVPVKRRNMNEQKPNEPGQGQSRPRENSKPVFDLQQALVNLEGDVELLKDIVDIFREGAPARLDELDFSLASGDVILVREHAHALKGSAGNCCATRLYDLALELEMLAREGTLSGAKELQARLHQEYRELENALTELDWQALMTAAPTS